MCFHCFSGFLSCFRIFQGPFLMKNIDGWLVPLVSRSVTEQIFGKNPATKKDMINLHQ